MPRFTALLTAVAFSAVTAAQAQTPRPSNEPVAHDHTLSEWIADLKAPAPASRNTAAYEIASLGPAAALAVPALIEALNDAEASVRYPVTVALREIGPAAKAAVPALKKVYEEDLNDEVASAARRALKAIAPKEVPQE
jgi:adenylate cyclase